MLSEWTETTLGEICVFNKHSTRGIEPKEEIHYVDLSAVSFDGGIDDGLVKQYELSKAPSRAKRKAKANSVIVSTVRPYLRGMSIVPESHSDHVFSTGFAIIEGDTALIDPLYLWSIVRTTKFADHLNLRAVGSNYPAVKVKDIQDFPVKLPPLVEQRRIVDFMSSLDDTIQTSETELERLTSVKENSLESLIFDTDEYPMQDLGEVAVATRKRGVAPDEDFYIALEHINDGGRNEINGNALGSDYKGASTPFQPGDVLFSKLRPYLNKVWQATCSGWCTNEALVYRPKNESISPEFLFTVLRSRKAIEHAINTSAGTRMPRTKEALMAQLEIPLPPPNEQQRIVNVMTDIDTQIHDSRNALESLRDFRSNALNSLISGEHEIPESYDEFMEDAS